MRGDFADEAMSVVKMSGATGVVLWGTQIIGLPMSLDGNGGALDATVDAGGDVYVAGTIFTGYSTYSDFAVARLDGATGVELWRYVLNGIGSDHDVAYAVSLDPNGDVVAAGYSSGVSSSNITVVKLDGDTGALAWPAPVVVGTAYSQATDAAVDGAGDVLVAGIRYDVPSSDFVVVKLSGVDGSEQWQHEVTGTGTGYGTGTAVLVDAADDVVAAGTIPNVATGGDFTVVKLAGASGSELWRAEVDGGTSSVPEIANAVRLGDAGQVIAAGTLAGPTGSADLAVVRLSAATGARLGVHVVEGTANGDAEGFAIATGPDGRIATAGSVDQHHLDEDNDDFAVVQFSDRLPGRKMLVADTTVAKRLAVKAADANVLAVPGDPGDPTVAGAVLELRNPGSAETASFALPAALWTRKVGRTAGSNTYIFKDPEQVAGPCRVVKLVSARKVAVSCQGLNGFTLDEASQGTLETRIVVGTGGARYCVRFAVPTLDEPGRFEAKNQPAPGSCS